MKTLIKTLEYFIYFSASTIIAVGVYSIFTKSNFWIISVCALPFIVGAYFFYLHLSKRHQRNLSIKDIEKNLYSGALVATNKGYIVRVNDKSKTQWSVTPSKFNNEPIRYVKIDRTLINLFKDSESKNKLILARKKGKKYLHEAQSQIFTDHLIGKRL